MKTKKLSKTKINNGIFNAVIYILLLLLAVIMLYPLIFVLSASFSDPKAVAGGEMLLLPVKPSLEGYRYLMQYKEIWVGYGNTIFYMIAGTLLNLAATLPCAYAMSRKDLKGRKYLMIYFMITMYFSGGMVPYYLQLKNLGMLDHFIVYIIPGMLNVYYMILIRSYIYGIPESLVESAKLDGANDLWVYGRIILPLSKPVVMTIVLFASIGHWNAWFDSRLYTNSMNLKTLQLVLVEILNQFQTSGTNGATLAQRAQMMSGVTQKSVQMAAVMVATIPIICVYPFVQKYFVKGIMIGAVKA